jgi:hypothetical protein
MVGGEASQGSRLRTRSRVEPHGDEAGRADSTRTTASPFCSAALTRSTDVLALALTSAGELLRS